MPRTIFTGFAPNLTKRDTITALKFLFWPWRWPALRSGKSVKQVEANLKAYFKTDYGFCFDSGRTALNLALQALGLKATDEVLVQAFTCVVVANAIIWAGAKPVYVDIDADFNLDPADLEKKLTPNSKVLIIQHTFGHPAQLDALLAIAKKHNLKVVEDCAHSFGISYQNQLTGTFGDIGMFSFGSDKTVSCVRGGALFTGNPELAAKIAQLQTKLPLPSLVKVIQHLLHYPFFYLGKKYYHLGIGRLILFLGKKLNLINKIIYPPEKRGDRGVSYPSLLANSLATILLDQLAEVDEINNHQKKITEIYNQNIKAKDQRDNLPYLRYPLLVATPPTIIKKAKAVGIILGDWYDAVIAPRDIDLSKTGYFKGSCPQAEKFSRQIVNLPTDRQITPDAAEKIINFINRVD